MSDASWEKKCLQRFHDDVQVHQNLSLKRVSPSFSEKNWLEIEGFSKLLNTRDITDCLHFDGSFYDAVNKPPTRETHVLR